MVADSNRIRSVVDGNYRRSGQECRIDDRWQEEDQRKKNISGEALIDKAAHLIHGYCPPSACIWSGPDPLGRHDYSDLLL